MSVDYTQQLRQAVRAIDKLQARIVELESERRNHTEPLAIVGMSCRFPGARNVEEYWELLEGGKDAIREVPPDRWDVDSYFDPDPDAAGKIASRFGGFVEGLAEFDPELFGISLREAATMDPQHRLLLTVTWESLENAGISPAGLAGSRTGVFIGIATTDYAQLVAGRGETAIDAYLGSGTAHSTATGRISYILGLEGPNLAIDTACSSSLTAMHQACNSLRNGECDLAITGGVNAIITPTVSITFSRAHMLARDGRCKTFDAAADGYVRGEGCGIVVLKRLSDAVRDGDNVLAVIRGSAVNQDGASSGLTVPNGLAQERVIRAALQSAGVEPGAVSYLEAHGTGTSLGDPIEVQAAANVLGKGRESSRRLLIGSAKTNLGHLEAAAGIAGFIKTVLALNHETIPASLHFRNPNPHIPWDQLAVRVAAAATEWPAGRRIAGVSAFGFSGTNAHVILEAPSNGKAVEEETPPRSHNVLVISGKSEGAVTESARRLREWMSANPDAALADICFTMATGRAPLEERAALVVQSRQDALSGLESLAERGRARTRGKCAWLFTGQGSQYPGMTRTLYETQPVFRAVLDRCDRVLKDEFPREFQVSLLSLLFGTDATRLNDTLVTQPALFAVEMGLAELWRSWGIEPDVVMGHSVGEYAAACVAGVFALEDGLRLIAHRGRLMSALPRDGSMAAIFAKAADVRDMVRSVPTLSIAAENGSHTVISGVSSDVRAMVSRFEERGVLCTPLATSHAFHSALMEPALEEFEKIARKMEFRPPRRVLISNVTGRPLGSQIPDAAYWRRHARQAVEFAQGVLSLGEQGVRLVIEIGPDQVLATMARRCWPQATEAPRFVSSVRRGQSETEQIAKALAQTFTSGLNPDFAAWDRPWKRQKLQLPTYPFQNRTCWIQPAKPKVKAPSVAAFYDAVGSTPLGTDGGLPFLTFGPLPEPVEGFSWLLTWAQPERHSEHAAMVVESQKRLREALFHHVRFDSVTRVLDFGCGLSSDLISLAKAWPHLELHGYTISAQQVQEGRRRAEANGVADRVSVMHADSAKDPFPSRYQLVFGFEVAHYIQEKQRLFANIEEHLEENGLLVLADFLSTSDVRIEHAETNSYFPALDEWVDLLSGHGLVLVEAIDISREIGNFLHDPNFDDNFAQLRALFPQMDETVASGNRSYHQLGRMLRLNMARYLLLTARKQSGVSRAEAERTNRAMLGNPVPYRVWSDPLPVYEIEWGPRVERESASGSPGGPVFVCGGDEMSAAVGSELIRRGYTCTGSLEEAAAVIHVCGGLKDLLELVQDGEKPLWVVTEGAQPVGEQSHAVDPHASAVWGFGRAIARERSATTCLLIDIAPDTSAAQLVDEILRSGFEDEVALRGGQAYVPRLVQTRGTGNSAEVEIRPDSAYLVTGGTGGLGIHAVEWLVQRGARHVFSLSRSGCPPHLKKRMEEIGCQCIEVDVTSRGRLQEALESIRSRAPIHGVIHSAGVVDDALIANQDWARFERVLAPKAEGALLLDELTREDPLDFFVLYSSLTAVLGAPGQSNYVAANAFLDGLAAQRRQRGLPALSVNWGLWREGGMSERSPQAVEQYVRRGGLLLDAKQAMAALGLLISGKHGQAVVAPMDWRRFHAAGNRPLSIVRELAPRSTRQGPESELRQRLANTPLHQRTEILARHLEQELAEVLQADRPPDRDAGFAELGMDSLMAIEFRNRIQKALQLDPPPAATIAFDYPSIAQLTAELAARVADVPAVAAVQQKVTATRQDEPIAVVGFACRFPGAVGPEAFWQLLKEGRDAAREIPPDRWDVEAYYDPDPAKPGKIPAREAAFVDGIDQFDPAFFGISPREAATIDPQHRMLLETSWEAFEHAGIASSSLAGSRTGVFVGISTHDYFQLLTATKGVENDPLLSIGNAFSTAAGRISHIFGFHGPCEAIDTACSSSLVAISHACDSLRNGRADAALAGGVNAILNPSVMVNLSRTGMVAPGGRCRSFDAEAEGYGRGEGCGMVLLKRLSDAERDNDRIWAVIRGAAVNHDGAASGLTVPNGPAQERAIREALLRAGVRPAEVSYLEAHGTGTPLGDPIEVLAAAAVYGEDRDPGAPLLIGSVKTNIGHLEAAAGVAGLIKVVLAMNEDSIPPHLHFQKPNPHVPWERLAVRVADSLVPWPDAKRRLAAVSSFGFSGTNTHVILEHFPKRAEAIPQVREEGAQPWLALSAKSAPALAALAGLYRDWLMANPETDLMEFCRAAATSRGHFEERAAIVAGSRDSALSALDQLARGGGADGLFRGKAKKPCSVAWRLSGAFQEAMDAARWFQARGIEPDVVFGDGPAEHAAGCIAGALSLEDAARLAADSSATVDLRTPQRTLLRVESGRLPDHGCSILLEVGLKDGLKDNDARQRELAQLYVAGCSLDFVACFGVPARRLTLPTYPFQKMRCWFRDVEKAPSEPAAESTDLQSWISALVQKALALDAPPVPTLDFLEMGMDSMIATELTRRIEERLGCKVPSTVVLDQRTVQKLAAYLTSFSNTDRKVAAVAPRAVAAAAGAGAPGLGFWQRFGAPADHGRERQVISSNGNERIGPEPISLWNDGSPAAIRVYHPHENVARTGACIVICPGGGYATLAMDTEGHQVARWLNGAGITAVVLSYRLAPAYRHPAPLDDARQALRFVREHADRWGLAGERIGMMGFSAGGHLAALVAASDSGITRPDFLVLGYPVISMTEHTNAVVCRNLLGDAPDRALLESLSAERLVTGSMPPTFLFHTGEDAAVPVEHSLAFYAALRRAKVPVELHTWQNGPHGAGLAPGDPVLGAWKDRLLDWIRGNGFLSLLPKASVEGEITLAGAPLGFGTITFLPGDPGHPTAWGPIGLGKFNIPVSRGPVPGDYVMQIRLLGALGDHPTIEQVEVIEERPVRIHEGSNTVALDIPARNQ